MREIKIGEIEIGIKASALTPKLYKSEFGRECDITRDILNLVDAKKLIKSNLENKEINKEEIADSFLERFDTVVLQQLTYIMNKTANIGTGNPFPSFDKWLLDYAEDLDVFTLMNDVIEEGIKGLFPSTRGAKHPTAR